MPRMSAQLPSHIYQTIGAAKMLDAANKMLDAANKMLDAANNGVRAIRGIARAHLYARARKLA